MNDVLDLFDFVGTAVFAVTGALAAGNKRMDIFGVVVLGGVTALGGGTLRDVILGVQPVFWIADTRYLMVAALAAVATFVASRYWALHKTTLLYADALGLATFTVIGFQRGFQETGLYSVGIVMGVMTSVVGGMVRDVLAGDVPLILRREIYASASLCGAILYALLQSVGHPNVFAALAAASSVLAVRLSALRWNVSLPILQPNEEVRKRRERKDKRR